MIYNLIIYLYLIGVAIYSCFNEKVRKMWRGERAAFGVLKKKVDTQAKYIWFHAASLGEFEQGRPLMERLRKEHPEYKILLTFFSPSGYEVRKEYEGADIICYLPLDTPINAIRFLRLVRPVMAFFIKYEFWYNYLHILKHRNVPVYSVSSIFRPDQVFFKWYGRQYGRVLNCFTHFFVQNEQSKQLLSKIRITNVSVVGDTRFDRVLQIKEAAKQLPIVEAFVKESREKSKVFVAGSKRRIDFFSRIVVKVSSWFTRIVTFGHKRKLIQQERINDYFADVHENVTMAKENKAKLKKPALWGLCYSLFEIGTYYIVALALGRPELLPYIMIGEAIGSVFDGIVPYGLYELGMAGVMIALGVDFPTATIVTVMTRVITLVFTIISGSYPYYKAIRGRDGK